MRIRGFTLIEMLVTNSIVLLMTIAFSWMLLAGKSTYQTSTARSAARQTLDTALAKITDELRNSRAASLARLSVPTAISFASSYDGTGVFRTTDAGDPQWQKQVVLWWDLPGEQLYRKELPSPDATPLTQAQLTTAVATPGQVVLRGVRGFALNAVPGGSFELVLSTHTANQQGGAIEFTVTSTFLMRN